MPKQRNPRRHSRYIPRLGWSIECVHTSLDGSFIKFLWANFYDDQGNETHAACKVLDAGSRWRSFRRVDVSESVAQLLRDFLPHRGQWVRIDFAGC